MIYPVLLDRCRALRDALLSLPDVQRRVVVLRWPKGETYAAVADAVGVKKGVVVAVHRDGLKAMRRWFNLRS